MREHKKRKKYDVDGEGQQGGQTSQEDTECTQTKHPAEILTLMILVVSTRKAYLVEELVPGALY